MVRISDARMSGTAYGTCVLHVVPRELDRRPAGIVEDGDRISLDAENGRIDLLISEAELARRRAQWVKPAPRYARGYMALYTTTASLKPIRAATSISWAKRSRPPNPRFSDLSSHDLCHFHVVLTVRCERHLLQAHNHQRLIVLRRALPEELTNLAQNRVANFGRRSAPALLDRAQNPFLPELLFERVLRLNNAVRKHDEQIAGKNRNLHLTVAGAGQQPQHGPSTLVQTMRFDCARSVLAHQERRQMPRIDIPKYRTHGVEVAPDQTHEPLPGGLHAKQMVETLHTLLVAERRSGAIAGMNHALHNADQKSGGESLTGDVAQNEPDLVILGLKRIVEVAADLPRRYAFRRELEIARQQASRRQQNRTAPAAPWPFALPPACRADSA